MKVNDTIELRIPEMQKYYFPIEQWLPSFAFGYYCSEVDLEYLVIVDLFQAKLEKGMNSLGEIHISNWHQWSVYDYK